jgi:predicted O-linked N-acetylglucosamine transferase (SPINDLY family)
MLWKVISGLLAARRKTGREAMSSGREPAFANYPTDIPDGKAIGGSIAEFIRNAEMLVKAGRLAAAPECYQAALQQHPRAIDAYVGMGNVLVDLWSMEEAVAAYRKALELAPHSSTIFSALLFHLHYLSPANQDLSFDLHRRFGAMMRNAIPPSNEAFSLTPDPERRLRIGYLSPNFSKHSVGYFIEPVIRDHDRERCEAYCYYTHRLSDATTERIRGMAAGWRDVADKSDEDLEKMIRDDSIDILVDLAGHSKGNRLTVFARKPAPVQMTWLGYPDTTGVDTVDFRITDHVADPEPQAERWHSERLLRVDKLFLCYQPPADSPPVNTNASRASEVVFSSFNNIAKVNDETVRLWSKILAAVPASRLVIKSASLAFPDTADRVLASFRRTGVATDRVELRGWITDRQEHLELYDSVDIALDTFPYNGTTTTCEALWMGVPVVSRIGEAHMSRVGAAILRSASLHELVAENEQDYVDTAVSLARDEPRRRSLRGSLRDTLLSSPLLDHAGFTGNLERHFRQAWAAWCSHRACR